MSDFKVGDRVRVKLEHDELRLLGMRTKDGTVVDIIDESLIVAEDGSTSAPYRAYELELVND